MDNDLGALLLLRRAGRVPEDLKGRGFSRAITRSHSSSFGLQPRPGPKPELDDNNNEALYGTAEAVPLQSAEPKDAELAREISQEVGGLPLALDQGGAYLEETGTGLGDYLALLRKRGRELLARRGGLDSDHLSVAATYLTSLEKLAKQSPAAAELLQACAFLVPDAIPEEIFIEGAAEFGPVLQAAASDPIKWDEAIAAPFKFSLIERSPGKVLAVHRMVQAVAKSRMSDEERKGAAEQVMRAVDAAFPEVEFAVWNKCERLVPSAQVCAALVDEYGLAVPEAARLLTQAGYYLHERARYAEAEPLYRRALQIDERFYGPDRPEVAVDLNNLAQLLQETNRLGEAEPLMRRALAIDEQSYGPDHPNVARDLNNLAKLLQHTNRLVEAEPLTRRVVRSLRRPTVQTIPVSLPASTTWPSCCRTRRMGEAEPLMRWALAIERRPRARPSQGRH